jgi:sulfane dehydrogenase subunit SoxC
MKERANPLFGAAGGFVDRRWFLRTALTGGTVLMTATAGAAAREAWMIVPGHGMGEIGDPSRHETQLKRIGVASAPGTTGAGVSRTPLQYLDGIVTPSRLHFERHHSGIPDIEPARHRLSIVGLVERPLSFSLDALERYPKISRFHFLECSGNSGSLVALEPADISAGEIHGLVSCSEWGGVRLSTLLTEAGVKPQGKWIVADGADAAMMSRSIPQSKAMDDAIVALFQNGEPLRPSNGYPMRLFLPGWEGNMSVKWLRTIKVTDGPAMTRDETSKYSDLRDDGVAELFTYPMQVKSIITSPSPGLALGPKGLYQVSGLAWSGNGSITRAEVSADGGRSWTEAALDAHVLPMCLTRFRTAWRWGGEPAVLMSRATDSGGNVQPSRAAAMERRAANSFYHYNGIQAWRVTEQGTLHNVYS